MTMTLSDGAWPSILREDAAAVKDVQDRLSAEIQNPTNIHARKIAVSQDQALPSSSGDGRTCNTSRPRSRGEGPESAPASLRRHRAPRHELAAARHPRPPRALERPRAKVPKPAMSEPAQWSSPRATRLSAEPESEDGKSLWIWGVAAERCVCFCACSQSAQAAGTLQEIISMQELIAPPLAESQVIPTELTEEIMSGFEIAEDRTLEALASSAVGAALQLHDADFWIEQQVAVESDGAPSA